MEVMFDTVEVGRKIKYFVFPREGQSEECEIASKEALEDKVIELTLNEFQRDDDVNTKFMAQHAVLVTGSSGYLGRALVRILRQSGCTVRGLDVVAGPCTTHVGSVARIEDLRLAAGEDCHYIFHCGALHAPNLDFYDKTAFEQVNVRGTANVLELAREVGAQGVVFSSTTSLMISKQVKVSEQQGKTVVLRNDQDVHVPRNTYGKTKLAAEGLCKAADVRVGILRCSRFFAEDAFHSDTPMSERQIVSQNVNVKVDELLCGVRASLLDMCRAHIRCMYLVCDAEPNATIGPLIISGVSPLVTSQLDQVRLQADALYKANGWVLPTKVVRIYDSRDSWEVLGILPKVTFLALLEDGRLLALLGNE